MAINKVQLKLDRRVTNDIKLLKRNVREMKTPQKVGGDILQLQTIPAAANEVNIQGPAYLLPTAPYNDWIFTCQGYPLNKVLTLWNFAFTLYVDPTLDPVTGVPDANNLWPNGFNLTPGQQNASMTWWLDWAQSDDTLNDRIYQVYIKNNDTANHNYYLVYKLYLPNLV
ncbi:MAG TPA: hypothetical protein VNG51_19500 [Ktedonobacteraceae bacterium]|nr:hypothetical protein [Ktedonobacteraceae bacterium]